jgi:hypothetical protein
VQISLMDANLIWVAPGHSDTCGLLARIRALLAEMRTLRSDKGHA